MNKKVILGSLFFLSIDIISKILININFNLNETKVMILNFFSITKVYNDGASWGLLNGLRISLILITAIMLVILIMYQKKFKNNLRNALAFSFLYGGIIGNLLDRLIYGYVIDFLDFVIFGYDFPVFNFADICITFGILLLIVAILKKEDNNEISSR